MGGWRVRAVTGALIAVLAVGWSGNAVCAAWCTLERLCVQSAASASSESHEHHHSTQFADAGARHHHGAVPSADAGRPTGTSSDAVLVSSECCQPPTGVPVISFVANRSDDVISAAGALVPLFLAAECLEQAGGYMRMRDMAPLGPSRNIQLSSILRI